LQYPAGTAVSARQIIADAGIVVPNEPGHTIQIPNLDRVDFNAPDRYMVTIQVLAGERVVIQRVIVIEIV